jgi:hypothetical protein
MFMMEFGSGHKVRFVLGFDALLAVPPGAAAIEIIPNVRGADDRHSFSPLII